jgi:hypothetical protein
LRIKHAIGFYDETIFAFIKFGDKFVIRIALQGVFYASV